jgi:hypothetical protein
MKWDERREKREDVCGMRHVLRRCFAEMTQREEKRLDLIATQVTSILALSSCPVADKHATPPLAL